MSKTLTTKKTMQALLDGKKITHYTWNNNEYVYLSKETEEFLNARGEKCGGIVFGGRWLIYEEPKPKKQVWQWRYKSKAPNSDWIVDQRLLCESDAANNFPELVYEKHAGPFEVTEE